MMSEPPAEPCLPMLERIFGRPRFELLGGLRPRSRHRVLDDISSPLQWGAEIPCHTPVGWDPAFQRPAG